MRVPAGFASQIAAAEQVPRQLRPADRRQVVNAYWSKSDVVLVQRSAGKVITRRALAEHSCFVRADAIAPERIAQLCNHPAVADARCDGPHWRLCFHMREDVERFCDAARTDGIATFEGAISPVLRLMADGDYAVADPLGCYLDLETDSRVPFSRKEQMRILSWAVVGEDRAEQHGCLAADTDAAERELLAQLWQVLERYDQVIAWAGDRFDFPVLLARSDDRRVLTADPRRWLWLDQLELFRRMNMSAAESGDEKQSFKLQDVAMSLLGEGKDDFDASQSWQAWAAGGKQRQQLVKYNVQDTRLLPRIEAETGYIQLLRESAKACGTFSDSRGINPSVKVEGFLQRLALQRGYRFPTKHYVLTPEKFKGAYVQAPSRNGIVRDVHVCDFSGMYPSIIRSWNMSPETLVQDGESTYDCALSPLTKQYFRQQPEGMLAQAVSELQLNRDHWKKAKAKLPPGTDAWKEAGRRSDAYKIIINSFYGVIGQPTGRFFERRVAESVAQCGVWLIKRTIEEAQKRGWEVVYVDTDGAYVTGPSEEEFRGFVKWCTAEVYPAMLREVGCARNVVEVDYEKQFERIIFTTAKRYVGMFAHYKGARRNADSRPEIKGLEYKRGDTLRLTRRLQEEVVNLLLGYKCDPSERPADYEDIMMRHHVHVLTGELLLPDVLMSKRLNKELTEYVRKPLKDGSGYARQLPHIELARALELRGMDMGEGAKVDYVVVEPEAKPQRIEAAVDWQGTVDRGATWRSIVAPPTVRLLQAAFPAHSWDHWLTMGKATKPRARAMIASA